MVDGFLLIIVKPNGAPQVYRHLANHAGISTIAPLYGEYDLLVQLTADTYDSLGDLVLDIQRNESIGETKFLPTLTR